MNTQEKTLRIDIPVKLTEVNIPSLSFEGDLPASLFHLQLIVNDISNWKCPPLPPISVDTHPGSTELTKMPVPEESSAARIRVNAFRAALETLSK